MKVLILTTSYPAYKGHLQSPFVYKLTKNLVKQGLDVRVSCPYYKESKSKHEVLDKIKINRFQYFYPRALQKLTSGGGLPSNMKKSLLAKIQFPLFMLSMFFSSFKQARECDLIHAQWVPSALVGVFLKKIFKKPLTLTTRGAGIDLSLKSKFLKKLLIFTLKNCDQITTICGDYKDKMIKLGIPSEKITRISNGVDEEFKPRNQKAIRRKLKIPLDKKVIIFVGWLIERKGARYLIDAVPDVVKKNKNVLFLIVGEGVLKEELTEKIKKLNMQKYIKMVGSKGPSEIPYWMNAADIFVLPTLADGRPNTIVEAMASGLPVITTKIPGPSEVVGRDRKSGYLINIKNSKQIADKILFLLKKPSLLKKLSNHARKQISSKGWTWKACAKNYEIVYNKILKSR